MRLALCLILFAVATSLWAKEKPWPIICHFEVWDKVGGTDTQDVVKIRPSSQGFEAQVIQEGHSIKRSASRLRVKKDPVIETQRSQTYQVQLARDDFFRENDDQCQIEVLRVAGDLRKKFYFVMTRDHFMELSRGPASSVSAEGEAQGNLNGKTYPGTKSLKCTVERSVYKNLRQICY